MPSVVLLGLNRFGESIYEYLVSHDETDVLALLTEEGQYGTIERLQPDLLISAGFDHIIPADVLAIPEEGGINLHPSYLPYNRGVNPDIWSIIRDEPAGVSIHRMSPEVDQGPIVARKRVSIAPDDTGRTLRKKLDNEMVSLFKQEWESIYSGRTDQLSQDSYEATFNHSTDFPEMCKIDPSEELTAEQLIDRLRALSFPPYHNAYFLEDEKKYYVEISITPEEEATVDEQEWDTPTLF